MTLTLDTTTIDTGQWDAEAPMVEEWLWTLWGIRPGVSSPRPATVPVHPACLASAGWLSALWGFSL
jgi:hypothetical protein